MMEAGKLRHRVTIERLTPLEDSAGPMRDAQGETVRAWLPIATVWASIEPLSVREFIAAAATQSQVTTRITIRYRDGLDAAVRIVHGGKIYNPAGFLPDKDSGIESLTIPCSEGIDQGQ